MQQIIDLKITGGEDTARRIETIAKALGDAKKTARELSDELDNPDGTVSARDLSDAYTDATKSVVRLTAELKTARDAQANQVRDAVAGVNKQGETYSQLSRRLTNLRTDWKNLTKEERDNIEVGGAMIKQIKALDSELKDLDDRMGVHTRKVGDYSGSIKDALKNFAADSLQIIAPTVANGGLGGVPPSVTASGINSIASAASMAGPQAAAIGMAITTATTIIDSVYSMAADAELRMAKVNKVFGESMQFVSEAADENAVKIGVATGEYELLAANIADLLKPMGYTSEQSARLSTDFVNMAGALSKWSAGTKTTAEVTEILRDGMLGETDALTQLGIVIDQDVIKRKLQERGLDDLEGEVRRQVEAQIIYDEVLRQSADAMSLANDQADSMKQSADENAAKWRQWKEELAEGAIPVLQWLQTWLMNTVDGLGKVAKGLVYIASLGSVDLFEREKAADIEELRGAREKYEAQAAADAKTKVEREKFLQEEAAKARAKKAKENAGDDAERVQKEKAADAERERERQLKLGEEQSTNRLTEALNNLKTALAQVNPESAKYAETMLRVFEAEAKLAEITEQGAEAKKKFAAQRALEKGAREFATKEAPKVIAPVVAKVDNSSIDLARAELAANIRQWEAQKRLKDEKAKEEAAQKLAADRLAIKQGLIDSAGQIAGAVDAINNAQLNKDLARINRKHKADLAAAKGNEKLIAQINAKRDKDLEASQKKAFERGKKIQIAQTLIQAAQGVVTILSTPSTIPSPFDVIFKGVQLGVLAAQIAATLSTIKNSSPGFKSGGFTGYGSSNDVAGVVHRSEYVIPSRVLSTPQGALLASQAEVIRTGRQPGAGVGNVDFAAQIINGINAKKVVLSLKDFEAANALRAKIQNSSKL